MVMSVLFVEDGKRHAETVQECPAYCPQGLLVSYRLGKQVDSKQKRNQRASGSCGVVEQFKLVLGHCLCNDPFEYANAFLYCVEKHRAKLLVDTDELANAIADETATPLGICSALPAQLTKESCNCR